MHIGILYVDFFIPDAQSLKQKRMVVKRIKDKVRSQFNVSVAELDGQDKWQTATLGFSMIGNDQRYINGALDNVLSFVSRNHAAEVCTHSIEFC